MAGPAIERMIAAAKANNGDAQYDLGLAYLNGDGVPKDYAEAMFWLSVCYATPNIFRSPSPSELIAEAVGHLTDKDEIADIIVNVVDWVADHGRPSNENY